MCFGFFVIQTLSIAQLAIDSEITAHNKSRWDSALLRNVRKSIAATPFLYHSDLTDNWHYNVLYVTHSEHPRIPFLRQKKGVFTLPLYFLIQCLILFCPMVPLHCASCVKRAELAPREYTCDQWIPWLG